MHWCVAWISAFIGRRVAGLRVWRTFRVHLEESRKRAWHLLSIPLWAFDVLSFLAQLVLDGGVRTASGFPRTCSLASPTRRAVAAEIGKQCGQPAAVVSNCFWKVSYWPWSQANFGVRSLSAIPCLFAVYRVNGFYRFGSPEVGALFSLTFNSSKAWWHSGFPSAGPLLSPFKASYRDLAISPKPGIHRQQKPVIFKIPESCYLLCGPPRVSMACFLWGNRVPDPGVKYPRYWTWWEGIWAFLRDFISFTCEEFENQNGIFI